MNEKRTQEMTLNAVLFEFRTEAVSAPNPAILDEYCRKYPQYARELADFAIQWLVDDALDATATVEDPSNNISSPLVSRAISRFHDRLHARASSEESYIQTSGEVIFNPFENLSVSRKRKIRDQMEIDQAIFAKIQNRLIEAATMPRRFVEQFAQLINITPQIFMLYLQGPPVLHVSAEFKALDKPAISTIKESFDEAVHKSSLREIQKKALLKN